ncbi:MAG: hypothetical protein NZ578_09005, partial [Candidatus Binatia bacterium]|nr:hypothetical protein [Candidatus Binatia bacterium]
MAITEILERFPAELQSPVARLIEALREEFGVRRADFDELRAVVRELAEAQKRTEQRVEQLAEAQRRTEQRVEQLAEAQRRTEQRVEELAEAQRQTELRLAELAEVQKLTTEGLEQLRKTFTQQIAGL